MSFILEFRCKNHGREIAGIRDASDRNASPYMKTRRIARILEINSATLILYKDLTPKWIKGGYDPGYTDRQRQSGLRSS